MSSRDSVEANASSGTDFDLPDDILSVMPTDPYDQLDLARKITSMAIASRVTELEHDVGRLRHDLFEKDQLIRELQESLTALNHARREADSRLKIALDDNLKLSKERDQLAAIVKKLSRDLAKLETFKKQLMQSLNDDNPSQAETIDVRTCDQSVPKAYPDKDNDGSSYKEHQSCIGPTEVGKTIDEDSRYAEQRFYTTPHITPRLTPTRTPMGMGTSWTVSSRGYSAPVSPKKTSGITSPTKLPYDGQLSIPSRCSLSQMSSAASSPPRGRSHSGRTPKIDGKEFFRQARSRLSFEQFSAFLANIKEFNAQKQTREETLRKADEIFGLDNKDLYLSFQGLLNRKAH